MIYNVNELRKDTVELIKEINEQITAIRQEAFARGIKPEQLRDQDGSWPLGPLLLAKATAYNTLVMLQSQERPSGRGPGATRH